MLCFMNGGLTGTEANMSGRMAIVTRSPLTGTVTDRCDLDFLLAGDRTGAVDGQSTFLWCGHVGLVQDHFQRMSASGIKCRLVHWLGVAATPLDDHRVEVLAATGSARAATSGGSIGAAATTAGCALESGVVSTTASMRLPFGALDFYHHVGRGRGASEPALPHSNHPLDPNLDHSPELLRPPNERSVAGWCRRERMSAQEATELVQCSGDMDVGMRVYPDSHVHVLPIYSGGCGHADALLSVARWSARTSKGGGQHCDKALRVRPVLSHDRSTRGA